MTKEIDQLIDRLIAAVDEEHWYETERRKWWKPWRAERDMDAGLMLSRHVGRCMKAIVTYVEEHTCD